MIGSPIAKGLVGLGIVGTGVTGIVLVTSKNKQQSESEKKQLELLRIKDNNSKLYEDCGRNLEEWNKYDPYGTGEYKKQKNEKGYDEEKWRECAKKYWGNTTKR